MKKLISVLTASTLTLIMVLTGCGTSQTKSAQSTDVTSSPEVAASKDDSTFVWALQSDIVSLDPAFAYDLVTGPVVNQISESLLVFDDNAQLQPLLAESWEVVDPTTYVYHIRKDVTFSDGTPMTIDDVVFSLKRYADPEVASYVGWMYANVASIEKTGDWDVTIKLSKPDALWQYTPATSGGHVISKAYYEAHSADFGKPTGGTMGTGPYIYESWATGSEIVLTKNENYWDKTATLPVNKVIYKIINEDTTRISAMTMGQADFTLDPPVDMISQLEEASNLTLNNIDTYAIDFLSFNTQIEPFNDVNVRRAIACAVDKATISSTVLQGIAVQGNTIPMGHALWTIEEDTWKAYSDSSTDYPYDLQKAKEYLSQSKYPDGFNCKFLTNELSTRNSMALIIQEALKELNINLTIEKVSNDELINMQFGSNATAEGVKNYDMGIFTWISDFPDPSGNLYPLYLSTSAAEGGSNTSGFNNPKMDELLRAQSASIDAKERTKLMLQACDVLKDEVPTVMIDYPKTVTVFGEKVEPRTISSAYIWNLYIKDIKMK